MPHVRVDRIEDGTAVLEHDGRVFELPAALLPAGAREGDVLALTLTRDEGATTSARAATAARRAKLSRDDDGGDFSL